MKNIPSYRLSLLSALLLFCSDLLYSQGITYNHDEAVNEKFKSSSQMLEALRGAFLLPLEMEKPYSETIDSSLSKRMKVEELNIAERMPNVTDVAYMVEKGKVEGKLEIYKNLIEQIDVAGGTVQSKRDWTERYNCLQCGLKAVREAYLPLSKRKEQYLAIYRDTLRQITELYNYLHFLRLHRGVNMDSANPPASPDLVSIAGNAHEMWKYAFQTVALGIKTNK